MFFKRGKLLNLLKQLETQSWDVDQFDDNEEYVKSLKTLKLTYQMYVALTVTCSTSFYFERYVFDGRKLAFNLPFLTHWPKMIPFDVLFFYEVFVGYALVIPIFCMDILMLTILSLTEIQFRLMNREFENMFRAARNMNFIQSRIRSCNTHLTFLLRQIINDTFSEAMLTYMAVIIPILCIQMYVISTHDSIKEILQSGIYSITLFIQFFFCYCLPAQKMINAASQTANSLYLSDWYNYPNHFKDVLLMLGKAQTEVYVSAGGIARIDLKTGMDALKTMISYCMFCGQWELQVNMIYLWQLIWNMIT